MKIHYSETELDAATNFIANNNPAFINQFTHVRSMILKYIESLKDQNHSYIATMGFHIKAEMDDGELYVDILVSPDVGMYDKKMQTIDVNNDSLYQEKYWTALNQLHPQKAAQVDDHTCVCCGNTKCSKVEKSCWKCGTAI
jgi:predicted AlkP superfamily pyrophosphatase or phosphodiesterase